MASHAILSGVEYLHSQVPPPQGAQGAHCYAASSTSTNRAPDLSPVASQGHGHPWLLAPQSAAPEPPPRPRLLRQGVIHRDLKLANLLLAVRRDLSTVRLADFGLAKAVFQTYQPESERAGMVVGTPLYAAPETVVGGVYETPVDCWQAAGPIPPIDIRHKPVAYAVHHTGASSGL